MINTTGITTLYGALTTAISDKLNTLYTEDKIDAETYAKIMAQSFDEALKLAVSAIQNQEQIDKDIEVKTAQIAQVTQQTSNLAAEGLNIPKQGALLDAQAEVQAQQKLLLVQETAKTTAQATQVAQQTSNLIAEALNIPKQGALIDAQAAKALKEVDIADAEILIKQAQVDLALAEVGIAQAKLVNLPKEGELLDKQAALINQQGLNAASEKLNIEAKTAQLSQQTANLLSENANIAKQGLLIDAQAARTTAEKCKLDAEFDVLVLTKAKVTSETTLLDWKTTSEKAQTTASIAATDSVLGKQMGLYQAQADGFKRDAEQKAAKILVDSWNVRMTTNDATIVPTELDNTSIGQVVTKLKQGVGT